MKRRRLQRLDDLIQRELADILLREIRDPRLGMVSVLQVQLNSDMTVARISVSPVVPDEEGRRTCQEGLARAAGHIRRLLGQRLDLRRVPELRFELDTSIERGDRILSLIEEVAPPEPSEE